MMPSDKATIFVIEPDIQFIHTIRNGLELAGYTVEVDPDGTHSLEQINRRSPDLILLEPLLPDLDGFDLCRQIRNASGAPIVMVTSLTSGKDRILGLRSGADDYLSKPFDVAELMARIRAILRRTCVQNDDNHPQWIEIDGLIVDLNQQKVVAHGKEIELTANEYCLLVEMIQQANRILPAEYLLGKIWGSEYASEVGILGQAIHRLRRKIEPDLRHPLYIQTKSGEGYMFCIPDRRKKKVAYSLFN
jgi:two-component system alkaline phosphatase synthesis response regulator PhoP